MAKAANVLEGYAADAADLVPRFESLSTAQVLAPIADCLPLQPCRLLDVGAGTGRDAAWFAARGHQVVAAEPVPELREAGMILHPSANISWIDDRLPALERVRATGQTFHFVLAVAVWQHLRPQDHPGAVTSLAALTAPGGRLILSLRHGPGSANRPCFPVDPEQIVARAEAAGLRLAARRMADSVQPKNREAGVTWTWLCLERP